jgi:hypothetical protein
MYEQEDVTVLWNQAVHTDKAVMANRSDILIKKKMKTFMLVDVAMPAGRNVVQKETEIQEFVYRDTTNLEPEM